MIVELDDHSSFVFSHYYKRWQCIKLFKCFDSRSLGGEELLLLIFLIFFFVCDECHILAVICSLFELCVRAICLNCAYVQSLLIVLGLWFWELLSLKKNMSEFSAVALSCLVCACRMWVFGFEISHVYPCYAYQCLWGFWFLVLLDFKICFCSSKCSYFRHFPMFANMWVFGFDQWHDGYISFEEF